MGQKVSDAPIPAFLTNARASSIKRIVAFDHLSARPKKPPTPLRKGELTSLRSFAPHTLG